MSTPWPCLQKSSVTETWGRMDTLGKIQVKLNEFTSLFYFVYSQDPIPTAKRSWYFLFLLKAKFQFKDYSFLLQKMENKITISLLIPSKISMWKHKIDFHSSSWLNKTQLNWWRHLPAEGSDGHSFGLVTLKLPQRKKSSLLVPELIRWILVIFKIWKRWGRT